MHEAEGRHLRGRGRSLLYEDVTSYKNMLTCHRREGCCGAHGSQQLSLPSHRKRKTIENPVSQQGSSRTTVRFSGMKCVKGGVRFYLSCLWNTPIPSAGHALCGEKAWNHFVSPRAAVAGYVLRSWPRRTNASVKVHHICLGGSPFKELLCTSAENLFVRRTKVPWDEYPDRLGMFYFSCLILTVTPTIVDEGAWSFRIYMSHIVSLSKHGSWVCEN